MDEDRTRVDDASASAPDAAFDVAPELFGVSGEGTRRTADDTAQ
jgi:hypothetical protein